MSKQIAQNTASRRALPREVRRQQLIQATMKSIAQNGLSGTTMATVTREAGLSMGIANLHFDSKEKMLIETLQYVTDEYTNGQLAILDNPKFDSTAKKIQALLDFDLSNTVTQKIKIAVWLAFWGEAKSRPIYQRIRAHADIRAENAFRELFNAAITESGYENVDAELIATGYTALIDGLWLDLLVSPKQFNRTKARKIASHYLATAFPDHVEIHQ
ncbi:MAG: transcriptional regulator BetI [Halioglobus sp.]